MGEGGSIQLRPENVELADAEGVLRVCGVEAPIGARDLSLLARVISERVKAKLGEGFELRVPTPTPAGVKVSLAKLEVGSAYLTASFDIGKS
jgi:hypothetical protein